MSGSPNPPWEGSRLLVDRRPTKQVLPSTSAGRRLCLATHLGPLMPAGHSQPPWQGTQLLLVPVGWIFHSVTQLGAVPKVVDSGWPGGYLSGQAAYPIPPHFPRLGQRGKAKQTGHAYGVMGKAFRSPACPPKLKSKLPTGLLGLLGPRQRCYKDPHFQHLWRGKSPRCESGIHLAGIREGAAICCPILPFPDLTVLRAGGGCRT